MRFVIVTGMSGAGKLTAQKMMEDMGYYCVDNLPVPLIPKFVELILEPSQEITKVVLGIDVRADQSFDDVMNALEDLKNKGFAYQILFMEASTQVLLKRSGWFEISPLAALSFAFASSTSGILLRIPK